MKVLLQGMLRPMAGISRKDRRVDSRQSSGSVRSGLAGSCTLALTLGVLLAGSPAVAGAVNDRGGQLEPQIAGLPTGDQLLVSGRSESVRFAGQDVQLDGFSGIFGFGSEAAYVLVVDGEARAGGKTAGRGRMLMFAPFGSEVASERFDAVRLRDALATQGSGGPVLASLDDLAGGQKLGMFFGRLSPTNFNLATAGSTSAEVSRRQRVGSTEIRKVRFASAGPGQNIEQTIVEGFFDALAQRDAASVAQYLDPLPYGYNNLESGGGAARQLIAQSLIDERDWSALANATPTKTGDTQWVATAGSARSVVNLRRTTEFAFVQSIETGK